MSLNKHKENVSQKFKLKKGPQNKTSTSINNDSEPSISKFEGTILGTQSTKNEKKPILLNKAVGKGAIPKKSNKNVKFVNINKNNDNKINIEELESKLDNIKSELLKENGSFIDEINTYNTKLSQQQKEINLLNKENADFLSNLTGLRNEMDSKIKLAKIFNLKHLKLQKEEKELKSSINCREEEKKIELKNSLREKKEKEKMQLLLEENEENREILLHNEIKQLEQKIKLLKNETQNLKFIINEHEYCKKTINNLKHTKSLLANEYDFEIKKLNMFNDKIVEENTKKEKVLKIKLIKKKSNIDNKDKEDKKKEKIEIKTSAKNFIYKQFELANKNYIKKAGDNYFRINESSNIQKPKKLFLNQEIDVLRQIIPEKNIYKFNERYNSLEYEKKIIEERMKNFKTVKNEINNNKNLIDYSQMKIKEQKIIKAGLKSDFIKYKKTAEAINNKIKELAKEIKIYDNLLKYKNKENNNYRKHLYDLQQKINSDNSIKKQNLEEENDINNDGNIEEENGNEEEEENVNKEEENVNEEEENGNGEEENINEEEENGNEEEENGDEEVGDNTDN